MILRLFLFVLAGLIPVAIVGRAVYRTVLAPRLEERAFRRLGSLHARFTCAAPECTEYVDPRAPDSIFESRRWWHRRCLKKLLG